MATSVFDTPLFARALAVPQVDPVVGEFKRQLKGALIDMRAAKGEGGRQAAQTLRTWAAYGAAQGYDSQIQRAIRRIGKQTITTTEPNHAEMERLVRELGEDPLQLNLHDAAVVNPIATGAVVDLLMKQGITSFFIDAAKALETAGDVWDRAQRSRPVQQVSRQCADCTYICDLAGNAGSLMVTVCGLARIIPALAEVCAAATASWATLAAGCAVCREMQFWFC